MTILVLFFDFCLDGCIWNFTCCDISIFLCFNYWSYQYRFCHNCWTRKLLLDHPLTLWIAIGTVSAFDQSILLFCKKDKWFQYMFFSVVLIVFGSIGMKHSLSWSCFISFIADWFAASPNLAIPCLRLYVIKCWVAWIIGASQTCR